MGTISVRRVQKPTAPKRRKVRNISRRELHQVRWGGFSLTIRLFPFRGWMPVALNRMFPVKAQVWPIPPLETVT